MSALPKIFARCLIVCYLATSSIAAVHAFPMLGNLGGADQIAPVETMTSGEDAAQAQPAMTMMACHQDAGSSGDISKDSGICKISCSAISHAFLSNEMAALVSNFHAPSPYIGTNSLTTRQPAVEHQPPK